jgi:hypothetical protein
VEELASVETISAEPLGAPCVAVPASLPPHATAGDCTTVLDDGAACSPGCAAGYTMNGRQARCADGALVGGMACDWSGKEDCWSPGFAFANCCDTSGPGPPGAVKCP